MNAFSQQLVHYLEISGKTRAELADHLGVGRSTVSMWIKNGNMPRMKTLYDICQFLNIPSIEMLTRPQEPATAIENFGRLKKGVVIPVLGSVAAGIPIEAIEDVIDTEEITQEMAATGKFFGLKIKGNSMEPRICNGDVVIVRQQEDAESGDIIIACVNGDEATCKRLRKYEDGIALISSNPSYDPMYFSNKEIEQKPVSILGKVVELRGKL